MDDVFFRDNDFELMAESTRKGKFYLHKKFKIKVSVFYEVSAKSDRVIKLEIIDKGFCTLMYQPRIRESRRFIEILLEFADRGAERKKEDPRQAVLF